MRSQIFILAWVLVAGLGDSGVAWASGALFGAPTITLQGTVIFIGPADHWEDFDFASSGQSDYLAGTDPESTAYLRELGIELGSAAMTRVEVGFETSDSDHSVRVFSSSEVMALMVGEFNLGTLLWFDLQADLLLSRDATAPFPHSRIEELCSSVEPCDWLWMEARSADSQIGVTAFAGVPGGTIPEEAVESRNIEVDHYVGYFLIDMILPDLGGSGVPGSVRIGAQIDTLEGSLGEGTILVIEPRASALMIIAILAITLLTLILPRRSAV